MRVLVTWGSKRGGTEGIARAIGEALAARGYEVTACDADEAPRPDGFDAVLIGGALYANRWHRAARRYANRNAKALRRVPTWLFSSGPLDESADHGQIPPTGQVATIAERIGAREHVTFGGRLTVDAKGFAASAMAKTKSGDWRNAERVRAWAGAVADALPSARPGVVVEEAAQGWPRVLEHAIAGWLVCAAAIAVVVTLASARIALAVNALLAPVVFGVIANHYFRAHGARDPLPTAAAFAGILAVLEIGIVAVFAPRDLGIVRSVFGFWLPVVFVFCVTWAIGAVRTMLPFPKPPASAVGT